MMRRGFTLLELLMVVAIMSFIGVAASSGYSALTRGMSERGAVSAASAVLRAAKERAAVDRVPTAVFCYNKLLREATQEEDGRVVGVMTAVRRSGRLSYVAGTLLYDEFADLNLTYESEETESDCTKGRGMRLFKFSGNGSEQFKYSIVADRVYYNEDGQRVTTFSGGVNNQTNLAMAAFVNLNTSDHEPSGWKIGDGYGFCFAEVELPAGFIFGNQVPSQAGQTVEIKTFNFDPDDDATETVDIWSTKANASGNPAAFRKAGVATAKSDEGV